MVIRHALKEDVKKIMEIYEYARRFMAEHGPGGCEMRSPGILLF